VACHFAEEALKTDVGIAHLGEERARRGTPAAALAVLAQARQPAEPHLEAPAALDTQSSIEEATDVPMPTGMLYTDDSERRGGEKL
jgi:hypothetical protein